METKICTKCKKEKPIDNYYYRKDRNYYSSYCKECHYKKHIEYIKNNREKINELSKKRYQKNKEEIKNKIKEYKKNNKNKIKEYNNKWYQLNKEKVSEYKKNKRKNDTIFKIKGQIRHLLNMSFKRRNYKKNSKTEKILGCSYDIFINHLLETYKKNYEYEYDGIEKVHIDHIIPLSTAKTEKDVIKLCHYTNLQLLKEQDNYEKSNKINWEIRKEN